MNATEVLSNPIVRDVFKRFGYMFYILNPLESSFEKVEEVPYYINQVIPCFLAFIILEHLFYIVNKDENYSVNDGIGSISQGIFSETFKLYLKSFSLVIYIWVYENYRWTTLPWDSVWTWIIAFIVTDFLYYVVHRSGHEVNFMWAAHQVHHSSEYYNFTTALRQSAVHNLVSFYLYLPMALAVPPSAYLVHQHFNLIYQFWIHTEVVKSIGPLEYILNTPSHHRVHHGRNRYCIDKNFGGTLIIWDRIFGTFEAENDKVVYGLVHSINTFDPFYIQLCHYQHILKTAYATKGFLNKVKVFVYGPGWEPGKPRNGLIEDIPDIKAPCPKYNPPMQTWCKGYILLHFILFSLTYLLLVLNIMDLSGAKFHATTSFVIISMASLAAISDAKSYAPILEFSRCLYYFFLDYFVFSLESYLQSLDYPIFPILRIYFAISAIIWLGLTIMPFSIKIKPVKKVD